MSWKRNAAYSHRQFKHDCFSTSGEERAWPHKNISKPATTSEDALLRAAKRFSSALYWLRLDLTLLAKVREHSGIIDAAEKLVQRIGYTILPQLGQTPISEELASRPEIIDL
eukprot:3453408-Karenia_brevis.AAC.1